jgi:hypothetical protein
MTITRDRAKLAGTWHRLAQSHRRDVFGARHETTMPLHLPEDASCPRSGTISSKPERPADEEIEMMLPERCFRITGRIIQSRDG